MDELLRLFRKFNFMKGDPDSLVESYTLKGILKLFPEEVIEKITEGFDTITKNTEELLTAKSFLKLTEEAGLFPELPCTVWDEENYPVFIIQTDLYCRLVGKSGFA